MHIGPSTSSWTFAVEAYIRWYILSNFIFYCLKVLEVATILPTDNFLSLPYKTLSCSNELLVENTYNVCDVTRAL